MSILSRFFDRWRRRDEDLDSEVRAHLDMSIRDRIAAGESPEQAERNARREFGNVGEIKEITRTMWGGTGVERFVQDIRVAARSLRRVPVFAAVAIATMALGIGANTAIFSVINGVILRPLPYPHSDRLVYITSVFPSLHLDHFWLDLGEFVDLKARNKSFESVAGIATAAVNVGNSSSSERVPAASVVGDFFHTLGVSPEMGRDFMPDDAGLNAPRVVILSHELWETVYGGDRAIVGKNIQVDGTTEQVIGVMPAGFDFRDNGFRLWQPIHYDPATIDQQRGGHFLDLVGRLKPGVTLAAARVELKSLVNTWAAYDGQPSGLSAFKQKLHTPTPVDHWLRYDDLQGDIIGSAGRAIWILQGAVGLVLLIACANMANLLLLRAESRRRELMVRAALGAGRWRLLRQFVAEGLVLSFAGAAVGVVIAQWGLKALLAANGGGIPRSANIHVDVAVLGFTVALSIATSLLFGLMPLVQLRRSSIAGTLHGGDLRSTADRARHRLRNALVVAEVALAMMLVIGAGLAIRSFTRLMRVDSGFDRSNLTTFDQALPATQYADSTRRVEFFVSLVRALKAVPGVQNAAVMNGLPPLRPIDANDTQFEGYTPQPDQPQANVDFWQFASSDYLQTMRIPVVAGRGFDGRDGPMSAPVVLINQALARRFYPGQNPIGRRLKPGGADTMFTIVGIVKDVKQLGLDTPTGTELYIDYDQAPAYMGYAPRNMHVVVRSVQASSQLAAVIRQNVAALDPLLPVSNLRSMDDVFAAAASRPHFLAELLSGFGMIALLLAAVGTYGVLSYSVSERRRELGIRMALGAAQRGMLTMVLRDGLRLAGLGVGLGLIGAFGITRLAKAILFGVSATDPVTFVAVSVLMVAVAFAACAVPAWSATRVDPITALRME